MLEILFVVLRPVEYVSVFRRLYMLAVCSDSLGMNELMYVNIPSNVILFHWLGVSEFRCRLLSLGLDTQHWCQILR